MRGVADQREAVRDHRRRPHELQRKAGRRRQAGEGAEHVPAGDSHALGKLGRRQLQQILGHRVRCRPDDRHAPTGKRQPGEDAAVRPEPLVGAAVMGALAGEVGDDADLSVGPHGNVEPRCATDHRPQAVGAHDQPRGDRRAVLAREVARIGRPGEPVEAAGGSDLDAGGMDLRDERSAQRALLDDPGQRPLAVLVGREVEQRTVVARDTHRLHRRDALGRQRLPGTDRVQPGRAARADRVDANVPAVRRGLGRRGYRPVGEHDVEPAAGERRCERQADEPRAGDQHVAMARAAASGASVVSRTAHAGVRPSAPGSGCSTSMTWFWLV